MIPALFIAAFVTLLGLVLYIFELRWRRKQKGKDEPPGAASMNLSDSENMDGDEKKEDSENGGECCGLHLVCEKDSLSPMSAEILYYDDEELDRFVGRSADSYTPEEEEEFRDVLMTLRADDVAGWARSITQRHLELPPDVHDALMLLVREQRDSAIKVEQKTGN